MAAAQDHDGRAARPPARERLVELCGAVGLLLIPLPLALAQLLPWRLERAALLAVAWLALIPVSAWRAGRASAARWRSTRQSRLWTGQARDHLRLLLGVMLLGGPSALWDSGVARAYFQQWPRALLPWILPLVIHAAGMLAGWWPATSPRARRKLLLAAAGIGSLSLGALLTTTLQPERPGRARLGEALLVRVAPRGDWAYVWGDPPPGPWRRLLLDTAGAGTVSLGSGAEPIGSPFFSSGGTLAAWCAPPSNTTARWGVVVLDLGAAAPVARATGIAVAEPWADLLLSASGDRIAVFESLGFAVYELPAGRLESAWRYNELGRSPGQVRRAMFRPGGRLRLYAHEVDGPAVRRSTVVIHELELASGRLAWSVRLDLELQRVGIVPSPDGARLILSDPLSRELTLHHGRSGALLARFAVPPGLTGRGLLFLAGGALALVESADGAARLRLFSADGEPRRSIALGPGQEVWCGGQPDAGRLFVTVAPRIGAALAESELWLVDLETGTKRGLGRGLLPVHLASRARAFDPSTYPPAGSPASRMFVDPESHLWRWNPPNGWTRLQDWS